MEIHPTASTPAVQIERVDSYLTPSPGCTVEQVLTDAKMSGYESYEVMPDGVIHVVWYRRKDDE